MIITMMRPRNRNQFVALPEASNGLLHHVFNIDVKSSMASLIFGPGARHSPKTVSRSRLANVPQRSLSLRSVAKLRRPAY